mgnify:FL=1
MSETMLPKLTGADADRLRGWLLAYEASAEAPSDLCVRTFDRLRSTALGEPAALDKLADLLGFMAALAADPRTLCSALLFVADRHGVNVAPLRDDLPASVKRQVDSLLRLQQVQAENVREGTAADSGAGAEGLRRLLLALVSDVRVVLIALAW